jgi:hypothetical protein
LPAGVHAGFCVVACAVVATVGLNVHAEKAPPGSPRPGGETGTSDRTDISAKPRPAAARGGIAGGTITDTSYATGFELAEGFAPGHIDGQVGWTSFASSTAEGHIDTVNPALGEQHLRISLDPALGSPVDVGAFSPNLGVFESVAGTVSMDINVTALGGAQYEIQPQTPAQGVRATNIQFRRTGDIFCQTAAGWVNSGADWVPGVYRNLTIVLTVTAPGTGTIETFYDGVSIHSTAIFAGDAIQEVVISSNNAQFNDDGDFDNFEIIGGALPTGACCNFDGQSGCQVMSADDCLAAGGFYLGNDTLCDACPTGACCNFDGQDGCEVMTPYECESYPEAFYLGDNEICASCPPVPDSCGPGAGDCYSPNGTPGCEEFACCAVVCADVPLCCINVWDQLCADIAIDACPQDPACGIPGTGDCYEANGSIYCDDNCGADGPCPGCCDTVCGFDPYCCDTEWDGLCADEAQDVCGCTPQDVPPNDDCSNPIPLTLGTTPVTNSCATAGGPSHGSCNDDGWTVGLGLDVWYTWTSDFDGVLTIVPEVPDGDWETQLAMYEGCDCQALEDPPYACATSPGNDQTADTATLVAAVTNGTCYLIRLGGTIDGAAGTGTLTLSAAPAVCVDGVGDCNTAHGGLGCQDPTCCVVVCSADPSCCDTEWDDACANLANQICPPYECPGIDTSPATMTEPELCGEDLNGGCNNIPDPATFTPVASGDIVHGMAWADNDLRDTDWFHLTVTAEDDVNGNGVVEVHYNIQSELPVVSFLIDDQNNPPGCVDTDGDGDADGLDTPGTTAYGQSCVQVLEGTAGVAAPGEYYIWVGTGESGGGGIYNGYPCPAGAAFGNNYLLCVNVTDDGEAFDPTCPPSPCPWDCQSTPDGQVNIPDFLAMLAQWGGPGTCDYDGNNDVNVQDFLDFLANFGPCP